MTTTNSIEILASGGTVPAIEGPLAERFTLTREPGAAVRGLMVAMGPRIDAATFDRLPALEVVSSLGVGYDHVDAAEAARRGIVVTHTPGVLTDDVADLAVVLLLAAIRKLPQADRYLREGRWLERPFPLTTSLKGRSVGILGLGRIGKAIAARLQPFGVELHYHGRSEQPGVPYRYHATLHGMATACDVLIVAAAGGAATRHLVNAEILRALGERGIVVNVGRGSIVDERALIDALRAGTILGAGLDVFEDEPRVPAELVALDSVTLLPHVGSATVSTRAAMAALVVDNLVAWFDGRGALTPVPECKHLNHPKG